MPVAHAVLGVLARGPRHGYELRRALEEELGADWRIDFGQLYRVLARLERAGWVRVRRRECGAGPTRKVRAITAAGRRELARWSAQPPVAPRRREATPVHRRFAADAAPPLLTAGSDDAVLDLLTAEIRQRHPELGFHSQRVGSLAGLWALREGRAQLAGIHLLDTDSGEFNVPFVKHLLPEESIILLTLARREQGLMLAVGNPLRIRSVRDLARRGVRLVNRQRGAGTRLLLHHALCKARVDPQAIEGWERTHDSHGEVAAAIAAGRADVGPGVRAAAARAGLEFLPLGEERYDLAIPRAVFDAPRLRPLLEALHGREFRRTAAALPGYDVSRMGTVAARVHG
ncbi:MAG TPA: substrate-binding domain-containing protein [Candidatus Dormibacteraeota bacterium]|nr:substrate-binding domain-containing protein [Candidatus Dormibacteraeota bacterium]